MNRHARVHHRLGVVVLAAALTGGCNVIKPELLASTMEDGSVGSEQPVPPADAPMIDVPLDAYEPALGNLVANPGFEVAGTNGWTTSGAGTLALWSNNAHQGTKCLLFSGRMDTWQGPAVTLTGKVRPGKQYAMSAWARLVDPGAEGFYLSVRHTCVEGGQRFNVGANRIEAKVSDNLTWAEPTTTFVVPDADECQLTELIVYVETTTKLTGSTAYPSFYLDDLEVTEVFP